MSEHDDDRGAGRGTGHDAQWLEKVRSQYNPPPDPPREEMWTTVRDELGRSGLLSEEWRLDPSATDDDPSMVDFTAERARRTGGVGRRVGRLSAPWAWASAAAAVLAIGIGIGRWSATNPIPDAGPVAVEAPAEAAGGGLELAARLHFERMEPFLATVRSDARTGRVDGSVGPWARGLLAQTRLLMDARGPVRDETQRLLADLELVLVQILGATEAGPMDPERAREELDLAIRSLERDEVLTRVRSAGPTMLAGA